MLFTLPCLYLISLTPTSPCTVLDMSTAGHDKHFRKIYVMGKIVYKEERVATAEDSPYRLAPGVKYYEVSVTSVTGQLPGGMDNMAAGGAV